MSAFGAKQLFVGNLGIGSVIAEVLYLALIWRLSRLFYTAFVYSKLLA